jgi:excinuclease UvrABC nuclease subunit
LSEERTSVPEEPGIYSLVVRPDIASHPANCYLFYVGKAEDLRERCANYIGREKNNIKRPFMHHVLNSYPNHLWFYYTTVPEADLITIEKNLIDALMPPINVIYINASLKEPREAFL